MKNIFVLVVMLLGLAQARAQEASLSVLTQNLWGLPVVAHDKAARFSEFCNMLKDRVEEGTAWDVVFIQEAWMIQDRQQLHHCGYPYVVDEDRFSLQTGLMILSQFPIMQKNIFHFQESNDPRTIDTEMLVHKGALFAMINPPDIGPTWLVTTHTAATYKKHTNADTRLAQLTELSAAMSTLDPDMPIVMGGDLNDGAGLAEDVAWDHISDLFPQLPEMDYASEVCTYCIDNFYATEQLGKIDHLFSNLNVLQSQVTLNDIFTVNGKQMHYSDHYALETVFVR